MAKKRKTTEYTQEFRENAIRLIKQPGRTVASVAEELKIPAWRLHNWIKSSNSKLERSADVDQLLAKDREIARLKEEIVILKKAAAYFAKTLV